MTEVDQRIVAMHFDNDKFEKNAKKTMDTLDELKEHLNFDGASKGLEELTKQTKDLGFADTSKKASAFSKALSGIQSTAKKTFSAATFPLRSLGQSIRSLTNDVQRWIGIDLAHTIEQAGKSFVKSLTIDPLSTGWNEYEMKMDSVKTIMSSTAKAFEGFSEEAHLETVKGYLEELNVYADKTIYSFKDMTSNIGKFTNAGVSLEKAVPAMKGIANLAASAGQGTQQASMAMYNFSQSMSMGYVELRDWRSIENANMATLEFKQTLIDVGLAMGTLKKDAKGVIKTNVKGQKAVEVTAENVRETLKKKWLTSDVLTSVLQLYSGDLQTVDDLVAAGLISKYKTVKGRSVEKTSEELQQEASAMLAIGQNALQAATQVRTFTKLYDALKEAAQSGWARTWELIIGDMNEATELWTGLNDVLSSIIQQFADARNEMFLNWRGKSSAYEDDGFGNLVKIGEDSFSNFKDTVVDGRQVLIDSLHELLTLVIDIFNAFSSAKDEVFGAFDYRTLMSLTMGFHDFVHSLSEWLGIMEEVVKTEEGEEITITHTESRLYKLHNILKGVFAIIKFGVRTVKNIAKVLSKAILPLLDPIIDFFSIVGEAISNLVDGGSWEEFGVNLLAGFLVAWAEIQAGIIIQFTKAKRWFADLLAQFFGIQTKTNPEENLEGWFSEVFTSVGNVIKSKWEEIVGNVKGWLDEKWKGITDAILGTKIVQDILNSQTFKDVSTTVQTIFDEIKKFFVGETITRDTVDADRPWKKTVKKASALSTIFDSIRSEIESAYNTFFGWIEEFKNSETYKNISSAISTLFNGITSFFIGGTSSYDTVDVERPWKKTARTPSTISTIFSSVSKTIDEIKNKVEKFFSLEKGTPLGDALATVQSWVNSATENYNAIKSTITEIIDVLFGPVQDETSEQKETKESDVEQSGIILWIQDKKKKVNEIIESVKSFFTIPETGVLHDAVQAVTDWIASVTKGIEEIEKAVSDFVAGLFASSPEKEDKENPTEKKEKTASDLWAETLYGSVSGPLKSGIDALLLMFGDITKDPVENIATLIENATAFANRITGEVQKVIDAVEKVFNDYFSIDNPDSTLSKVAGTVTKWVGIVHKSITDAISAVRKFFVGEDVVTAVDDLGRPIMHAHVKGPFEKVSEWFSGIETDVTWTISQAWETVKLFFTNNTLDDGSNSNPIVNFFDGMKRGVQEAIDSVADVWSKIVGWFEEKARDVSTTISGLWNSIVAFFAGGNHTEASKDADRPWKSSASTSSTTSPFAAFFGRIGAGVTNAIGVFATVWTSIAGWFTETKASVEGSITDSWDKIKGFFGSVASPFAAFFRNMESGVGTAIDGFTTVWSRITGWFGDRWSDISTLIIPMWNKIVEFFIGENHTELAKDANRPWKSSASSNRNTSPFAAFFGRIGAGVDGALASVGQVWTSISNWFKETAGDVSGKVGEWWESIKKFFRGDGEETPVDPNKKTLFDTIAEVFNNAYATINGIGDKIRDWTGWKTIKEFFVGKDVMQSVNEFGEPLQHSVKEHEDGPFVAFFKHLASGLNEAWAELQKSPLYTNISNFLSTSWDTLRTWLTDAWNTLKKFFTETDEVTGKTGFQTWIDNIRLKLEEFSETLESNPAFQAVKGFFSTLWETVKGFFTNADAESGETPFSTFINRIWNDIGGFINDQSKLLSMENILDHLNKLWEKFMNWINPAAKAEGEGKTGVEAAVEKITETTQAVNDVTPQATSMLGSIERAFSSIDSLVGRIDTKLSGVWNTVSKWVQEGHLAQIFESIKKMLGIGAEGVDTVMNPDVRDAARPWKGTAKAGALSEESAKNVEQQVGFFERIFKVISEFYEKTKTDIQNTGFWNAMVNMVTAIKDFFVATKDAVVEFAAATKESITTKATAFKESLTTFFNEILKPIIDVVIDFVGMFTEPVKKALEGKAEGWIVMILNLIATIIITVGRYANNIAKLQRKALKANFGDNIASKIFLIGAGIALIVYAVMEMVKYIYEGGVFHTDRLVMVLGGLAIIAAMIIGIYWAISQIKKVTELMVAENTSTSRDTSVIENIATYLIRWAAIFLILELAVPKIIESMKYLKDVDPLTMLAFAGAFVLLTVAMIIIMSACENMSSGKHSSGSIAGFGKFLLYFLGFFALLAGLGYLLDVEIGGKTIGQMVVRLFEFMGEIIGAFVGAKLGQETSSLVSAMEQMSEVKEEDKQKLFSTLEFFDELTDHMPKKLNVWGQIKEFFSGQSTMNASDFSNFMGDIAIGLRRFWVNMSMEGGPVEWSKKAVDPDLLLQYAESMGKVFQALSYWSGVKMVSPKELIEFFTGLDEEIANDHSGMNERDWEGLTIFFASIGGAIQTGLDQAAATINTQSILTAITTSIENDKSEIAKTIQKAYTDGMSELFNNGEETGGTTTNPFGGITETFTAMQESPVFKFLMGGEGMTKDSNGQSVLDRIMNTFLGDETSSEIVNKIKEKGTAMTGEFEKLLDGMNFTEEGFEFAGYKMNFAEAITPDLEDFDFEDLVNGMVEDMGSYTYKFTDNGEMINRALQVGLIKFRDYPESAMRTTLSDLSAMIEGFSPIDDLINNGIEVKIVPVLDMTEMNRSMIGLNQSVGRRLGLSPVMPSLAVNRAALLPNVNANNNYAQFTQAVTTKLDELNSNISNLSVYLNTGVLVGRLAPGIDRALGITALRYDRAKLL